MVLDLARLEAQLTMSTYSSSLDSEHHCMDEKIMEYSKLLKTVSDAERSNLQSKLLGVKLMKEKLVAASALAKAQTILAEMDVLRAENNLRAALEQLDTFTKDHGQVPVPEIKSDKKESSKSKHLKKSKPRITQSIKDSTKEIFKTNSPTESKEVANMKAVTKNKKHSDMKNHAVLNTPLEKTNKRKHLDNSSQSKSNDKRRKTSHDSNMLVSASDRLTLQNSALSPITKISTAVATGMQTYKDVCDKHTSVCTKGINYITHRVLEDDEKTILLDDLSAQHSSHQDAIDIAKTLRKVMPPKDIVKTQTVRSHSQSLDDLTQHPRFSKMELLFDDDVSNKATIRTEAPRSGDCDIELK